VSALSATHHVRTLTRRAPDAAMFGVPVEALTGDVTDPEAVRRAVRGADVVVHLAALLHIVDPAAGMRAEYERINVAGTEAVVEAARLEGVTRLVLMSTIAVYGDAGGGMLDEDSATAPDTLYGETKLAAEQRALAARRKDGLPLATVLRSSAVYGPRVKGNYQRLATALARRRFVPIGRGENLRTLIYEEDLAAAAALAARHPAAAGRIYNVSDGTPHRLSEIIDAISAGLGHRPPRWHLPVGPVRVGLKLGSILDRRLPRMLDKYLEVAAVDASRIQRELGFKAATGLMEGWQQTIETMRREGRL
jgi:UDP-glucose 4-epimerase